MELEELQDRWAVWDLPVTPERPARLALQDLLETLDVSDRQVPRGQRGLTDYKAR